MVHPPGVGYRGPMLRTGLRPRVASHLHRLGYYRDLVAVLTQKELKVRYKGSFLGYLWSIANPLAFALVFFVVFKVVMRVGIPDYPLFLIAGLFPWHWFQNSVNGSANAFIGNASLVKKLNFPRLIIPLTGVLDDLIHFLLSIPVIVFFLLLYGKGPAASWLYGVPLLILAQFILIYGIALAVSSINVFFRDLERLVALLTMLLFYVTPIIYSETMIPQGFEALVTLNPLATLTIAWRRLLLDGSLDLASLLWTAAYGVAALGIGALVYRTTKARFAEVV